MTKNYEFKNAKRIYSDEEEHTRGVLWVRLEQFIRFKSDDPEYKTKLKHIQAVKAQWDDTDTLTLTKLVDEVLDKNFVENAKRLKRVDVPAK